MNRFLLKIIDYYLAKSSPVFREKVFKRIGRTLGVKSYSCNGSLGVIDGSIDDIAVLPFYLRYGNWAPTLQKILIEHLFIRKEGTFIDIGANIGLTTIPVAKQGIQCFCFEPEFSNFASLKKNFFINEVEKNTKIFNFALFSEDTEVEFEIANNNMGDHRIRLTPPKSHLNHLYGENVRKTRQVIAKKLDSVLDQTLLQKPIVLKIDTQGAEVKVLKGASELLKKVDYIIAEYWPYGLKRMGNSTEDFIEIIKQFKYGATFDDDGEIPTLIPIEKLIEQLQCIPVDSEDNRHLDILVCNSPECFAPT